MRRQLPFNMCLHVLRRYMTGKMKETDESDQVCSDWKWCAMVLDRMFLWIVGIANLVIAAIVLYYAFRSRDEEE